MWDPQVGRARRALPRARYDQRGHGGSPVPAGPYSIADLGGDVVALLDGLGVERAHFCGLSLGGMVGMWLAAHAPERVERLVLCCTAAAVRRRASCGTSARALVRAEGIGRAGRRRSSSAGSRRRSAPRARCGGASARDAPRHRPPRATPAAARRSRDMDLRPALARDRRADARDRRRRGPADAARARRGDRRRHPRRAPARCSTTPRTWPTSSSPSAVTARASLEPPGRTTSEAHDRRRATTRGMRVRREVLGDAHVDRAIARTDEFTADFQDLITRYAWGEIWTRPGLDRRTRSCITLDRARSRSGTRTSSRCTCAPRCATA